jgi:hypothetical protein
MSRVYKPRPGSLVEKCIKHLQSLPPGAEVSSSVFVEIAGLPPQCVSEYLEPALRAGIVKRTIGPGSGYPWMWSLGDGTPMTAEQIRQQSLARCGSGASIREADDRANAGKGGVCLDPSLPVVGLETAPLRRAKGYTHDPRFQCAPGEQPFGAGFSAVGIGRDVDTGRAWR